MKFQKGTVHLLRRCASAGGNFSWSLEEFYKSTNAMDWTISTGNVHHNHKNNKPKPDWSGQNQQKPYQKRPVRVENCVLPPVMVCEAIPFNSFN